MLAMLAAVLVGLLLSGATAPIVPTAPAAGAPATPVPEPALPAVVWQLTAIALPDGAETVPDDPATYTLQFLPDGTLAIRADCNHGNGRYTVEGTSLTITQLATTEVGCPPGSHGAKYVGGLQEAVSYAYEEDALVLALRGDAGFLRFAPTLEGVIWEWQRSQGGNDTEVVPDDPAKYTLAFLPDGKVAIRADCNHGTGTYTVDGDGIDLAIGAMTEVGCSPGSLGDRFVRDMDDVVSHVFREGKLHLALAADAGIHSFAARAAGEQQATPTAG